jgi:hypothetical protein
LRHRCKWCERRRPRFDESILTIILGKRNEKTRIIILFE